MPYARGRRPMRRRRTSYRKRVLSRKNIRRRTSAKSQSRQIATLTRAVRKINRTQHETFCTYWQRNSLPVESLTTAGLPYICPVPFVPMDPQDLYLPGQGVTTKWRDNLQIASQPFYTKQLMFGYSDAALNSGHLTHTGGTIKYQMTSTEPSLSCVTLALISLKKDIADQKVVDNRLLESTVPYGPYQAGDALINGTDFHTHDGTGATGAADTTFGTVFNRKYWNVHYQRNIRFGHPGASNTASNVNPSNTNPANNSLVATGTIKIPAAGEIRSAANNLGNPATAMTTTRQNALQLGLLDQQNEKAKWLVCFSNGVTADNEAIFLGFVATDYYKAVV